MTGHPLPATGTVPDGGRGERLPELDWLRLGAVVSVLVVHSAQVFSPFESWHIDSPDESVALGQLTVFAAPWIMPLFTLLAGMSAWFSLQRRTPLEYARARVLRLFVPLVAGTLLLVPPQVYYRRLWRGEFEGSFLSFYPRFFDGLYPTGNFSYGHLWFIAYLILYLLAALPVFGFLAGPRGRQMLAGVAAACERPRAGGILILFVPLALGQLLLRVRYTQTTGAVVGDWATHAWLFTTLIIGYALMAERRLLHAVDRGWPVAMIPGMATWIAVATFTLPGNAYARLPGEPGWAYLAFWSGFCLASWSWMVVLLGAARRYASFSNRLLERWRGSAYAIYVFHQTVVVWVAYRVVPLPLGVHARFALVVAASLAGTLLMIEIARRLPGARALFALDVPSRGG